MKVILLLIILATNLSCFGQKYLQVVKKIPDEEKYTLDINFVHEYIRPGGHYSNVSNLLILHGFYFDTNKLHQLSIYDCLPNYNLNNFLYHFQLYSGTSNSVPLVIEKDNNIQDNIDIKHSSLYIFSRSDDTISKYLKNSLEKLSISFYMSYQGMDVYKLENISSQEEFCFRLNQIYNQTEVEINEIKYEENSIQPAKADAIGFSFGLESSVGLISPEISSDTRHFSLRSSLNSHWFEVGLNTRYNLNKNIYFNLKINQSKFDLTNKIDDTKYSYSTNEEFINERSVTINEISENNSITLNSFGLGVGWGWKPEVKNNLSLSISLEGKVYFASNINSRLTSGNLSYRGRSQSIQQPLINLPSLGLVENVNFSEFDNMQNKINGFAICPSIHSNYSILNFSFYAGFQYQWNYLNIDNEQDLEFISTNISEYTPSTKVSEKINNSILKFSFGFIYSLN